MEWNLDSSGYREEEVAMNQEEGVVAYQEEEESPAVVAVG